jgi:predicted Zn-dependent protease
VCQNSRTMPLQILSRLRQLCSFPTKRGLLGVLILLLLRLQAAASQAPAGASLASLQARLEQALRHGDRAQSQRIVSDILSQRNLTQDYLLQLGIHLAEGGYYDEGSAIFARCSTLYPSSFECHYNLALAELGQQHASRAREALRSAYPANEEQRVAIQYLRGKIEAALGEASEAKDDLQAAFKRRPGNENYALDLGLFYVRTYAYRQAVDVFTQGLAHHPDSEYLALGLALAQLQTGEMAQCRATTEHLLDEHPHLSAARLLLAYSLYLEGKFAAAEPVARQGLESPEPHPYLDYLHAAIELKLHSSNYTQMLAELTDAERGIPNCALCYVAASKVHQEANARGDALKDLQTAVHLDSVFPEAWYRLSIVEDSLGRHADAANARSRFKSLKASHSDLEDEMLRSAFVKSLNN